MNNGVKKRKRILSKIFKGMLVSIRTQRKFELKLKLNLFGSSLVRINGDDDRSKPVSFAYLFSLLTGFLFTFLHIYLYGKISKILKNELKIFLLYCITKMSKVWYSYKCRAECFSDIAEMFIKMYEYSEYKDIRILNTKIVDEKDMGFMWEFDSDKTLEELVDMIKRISVDYSLDIYKLYDTINYRAIF